MTTFTLGKFEVITGGELNTKGISDQTILKRRIMIIQIALIVIAAIFLILESKELIKTSKMYLVIIVGLVVLFLFLSIISEYQQDQEKKAASMEGVLESDPSSFLGSFYNMIGLGKNILFSTKDNIYPALELGTSGAILNWNGPNGKPMFQLFGDTPLIILKEQGQLKISTKIRGQDGLVAEIENNEWKINPSNSFDRNYNKNALEVKDRDGNVVLQIRLLDNRIQFQGKFFDEKGNGVALGGQKNMGGGIIEMTGSGHPKLNYNINPIFKYPSGLHFGETI
jgi:hypothetical protein